MGTADRLGALASITTRLVQSQSIGYDDVADALPPGHVFANAASVHETSTAELTLALVLAAQRGIPDFVRAAAEGRWAPSRHESLADRRVMLLGYGGVGRAIEARLAPFEVELVRVASRVRDDETGHVHAIDELPALLPTVDIVIVGVPLTDATTGLVDDAFLAALPDGALVVNIVARQGRRYRRHPRPRHTWTPPVRARRDRSRTAARGASPLRSGERAHLSACRRRLDRHDAPNGAAAPRADRADAAGRRTPERRAAHLIPVFDRLNP